jgi:PAS domain S-box-containing protein
VVILLAAGAGYWNAQRHQAELLGELVRLARLCAVSFASEDTLALSGTRADLNTSAYEAVKSRLVRLRAVNPRVRFVYLFRAGDRSGRVVFLADSEPVGSPDISLPGDDYETALESPGLQTTLADFAPATEGPLHDEWGEWVTAYAPVGDRALPGAPRIVLGVDVDSSHWRRELAIQSTAAFAIVFVLLGVPLGLGQSLLRERSLSREIRRLSTAIQQSHSAVFIVTSDRRIEYANNGALATTGYQLNELLGQSAGLLLPEELTTAEREAVLARLGANRWQGELRIRRRNGEVFPARVSFSPVRAREGALSHIVAVLDDITDLKRADDALRLARDQAQSADRAKGEFLAVMSHELRTPLNGIIGFATLLGDTSLSAEQSDYASTIRRSGEALLALTNELLDYSRIDAGRMQLDLQTCSPRQIVEEAVELLSTRAAEKNLELLVSIAPEVPAHVLADPGRLRQVLVNLIGNAIKFTPAGEVEVEVTRLPARAADEAGLAQLEFLIRDSGIGIAADKQDRLFKAFSQVDASTTRKHGGAGLGLAISRSLVQLMQGEIEVSSAAGAGSVFHFAIPLQVVESAEPLAQLPARTVVVLSANSRARAHYVRMLERWGLHAIACENLANLSATAPRDLLLVDVPSRDAALWPAILRTDPELQRAPAVGLVSVAVPGAVRDELRERFRALLKKPVRDTLLHAVLQSVLKR